MSRERINEVLPLFVRDVQHHEMRVLRDDGLYRHLVFVRPESQIYRFEIVTWPGHLAFSGDCGCFVFERVTDMMGFFRGGGASLIAGIDLRYWAEKAVSVDKADGLTEFDPGGTRRRIVDEFRDAVRALKENGVSLAVRRQLRHAVRDELLWVIDHGKDEARCALQDFAFDYDIQCGRRQVRFDDFMDWNLDRYSHRFVWCCLALRWAIRRYDEHKAAAAAQEVRDAVAA